MLNRPSSPHARLRILVVGPFMHQRGHYAVFPADLAQGFAENGAEVTLLTPFPPALPPTPGRAWTLLCLETRQSGFSAPMRLAWRIHRNQPILLALAWIVLNTKRGDFDLVYWSDFKSDNQASTWPLVFARWLGLYRHPTAFTEHHHFNWSRHRLSQLLRLDRLRLAGLQLFVHARVLLKSIQQTMAYPGAGHYLPVGVWPKPAETVHRGTARMQLGLPHDTRLLLVYGLQAIRRKEIHTLAAALETIDCRAGLTVVFAGLRTDDSVHPFSQPTLANKPGLHVLHLERFLDPDESTLYFAAADAIWAYYGKFEGASGVVMDAIAHGRLALCANYGESGEIARTYGTGLLPGEDSVSGVAGMLDRFMSLSPDEQSHFEAAAREAAQTLAWPQITRRILKQVLVHE